MTTPTVSSDRALEEEIREYIVASMPVQCAPPLLRLAFHDAGTYDVKTHTGGAHGAIHLEQELARPENTGWSTVAIEMLREAKERYPDLSWADLIALGGAAAVEKCGGPAIRIGLGRSDATEPAPEQRLPASDEGADKLRAHFDTMGLGTMEMVALSGAHTLGKASGKPFTPDPFAFSNTYFKQLLAGEDPPGTALLPSDRALLDDQDARAYVELYARDRDRFFRDFRDAYRRLTWLGGDAPDFRDEE